MENGDLIDLAQAVGRVESKLDQILDGHSDQERRLRKLENFEAKRIGATAAVSGVIGIAGGALWNLISGYFTKGNP